MQSEDFLYAANSAQIASDVCIGQYNSDFELLVSDHAPIPAFQPSGIILTIGLESYDLILSRSQTLNSKSTRLTCELNTANGLRSIKTEEEMHVNQRVTIVLVMTVLITFPDLNNNS